MYGSCTGRVRLGAAAMGVVAALLLAGCSSSDGGKQPQGAAPAIGQQPKEISPFWVNPEGKAAQAFASRLRDGDTADRKSVV